MKFTKPNFDTNDFIRNFVSLALAAARKIKTFIGIFMNYLKENNLENLTDQFHGRLKEMVENHRCIENNEALKTFQEFMAMIKQRGF